MRSKILANALKMLIEGGIFMVIVTVVTTFFQRLTERIKLWNPFGTKVTVTAKVR